ncbi:uncharacterized protein LOC129959920 [Argiope bruennichi]|uniref:uncharacterized protein LOC129959920 n=1 Tax=Argiope bruennichi TaxID=94029 RepID=UPI002493F25B|nr:uncharacterized protein LOC129959920 [Argiope bruennichi]
MASSSCEEERSSETALEPKSVRRSPRLNPVSQELMTTEKEAIPTPNEPSTSRGIIKASGEETTTPLRRSKRIAAKLKTAVPSQQMKQKKSIVKRKLKIKKSVQRKNWKKRIVETVTVSVTTYEMTEATDLSIMDLLSDTESDFDESDFFLP